MAETLDEKLKIVLNNVAEPVEEFVITIEDVKRILSEKMSPIAYIGYEPSGPIHIGYLPGIEKAKELKEIGFKIKILFADIHAYLNRKGPLDVLREVSLTYWSEIFKSLGLPFAEFIMGYDFEYDKNYVEDLFTLSRHISVHDAWRAMAIIAREAENPRVSQYIYPIMQILDILYLDADLAIGGTDQRKIHVLAREEFARKDLKLNHKVWVRATLHFPLLLGLTGEKMSGSKPRTHIAVHERPDTIRRKIKGALCPPDNTDPAVNPIFSYLRFLIFPYVDQLKIERAEKYGGDIIYKSLDELERDYLTGKLHPLDLKNAVANYIIDRLESARKRIEQDPDLLKPLAKLQKWQWERGYIDKESWKLIRNEYSYYGINI